MYLAFITSAYILAVMITKFLVIQTLGLSGKGINPKPLSTKVFYLCLSNLFVVGMNVGGVGRRGYHSRLGRRLYSQTALVRHPEGSGEFRRVPEMTQSARLARIAESSDMVR